MRADARDIEGCPNGVISHRGSQTATSIGPQKFNKGDVWNLKK
tara:strand:- start:144 stop:272 length:129 start_codon:yes stop_codon:yes gene_type:complete